MSDLLVIDSQQASRPSRERFFEWREGGVGCVHVTLAIWENARETLSAIGAWNRMFADHADLVALARSAGDIEAIRASGRTAVVLGFQNASPLEDDIDLVRIFHAVGVRIVRLTCDIQNHVGSGCWEDEDRGMSTGHHGGTSGRRHAGLTTGEKAVKKGIRCIRAAAALAVLAFAAAPAPGADSPPCPAGTDRWTEYRLFFGRGQSTAEVVTDEAWRVFLAEEITPRFPEGLSVLDAAGQWRDPSGTIVRERSKLVLILAEPGAPGMQRTEELAQAYRQTFGQESVLRVVTTACVSF